MRQLLDAETHRAHKTRNQLHSTLLLGGLAVLLAVPTFLILGLGGLLVTVIAIAAVMLLAPRLPPHVIMRMYGARRIDATYGGDLANLTRILSERAELKQQPKLYLIPSPTLNAFATGTQDDAAIGLTSGLVRRLTLRELAGVIAHEVSHIRNNDLWVMGLADVISRMTLSLSYLAVTLAILNVFYLVTSGVTAVSWIAIIILYFAPLLSSLMQLGLSRAREYDADLEGAMLTGDPAALASALQKLDNIMGRAWEDLMMPVPGRRMPQPSVLRTHPKVEDRIARLRELDPRRSMPQISVREIPVVTLIAPGPMGLRPRYRFPGVWY
ncbi:MAG: zinc metalloprotease HtpX [Pseudomonadota bacterium]